MTPEDLAAYYRSANDAAEARFRRPRMIVGTCEDREVAAFMEGAAWAAERERST